MSSLPAQAAELAALIQLYLKQEYTPQEWIFSEQESHSFFRKHAQSKKKPEEAVRKELPRQSIPQNSPPPPVPKEILKQELKPQQLTVFINPEPSPAPKPVQKETVATAEKKTIVEKKKFHLEPFPKPAAIDLQDIRSVLVEKFPKITLLDSIPDNKVAITPVVILYKQATPAELSFLKNLMQAISISLAKTSLFESFIIQQESLWKQVLESTELKLIITQDPITLPSPVPVVTLSTLSDYFKDPQKKQALWKEIKSLL